MPRPPMIPGEPPEFSAAPRLMETVAKASEKLHEGGGEPPPEPDMVNRFFNWLAAARGVPVEGEISGPMPVWPGGRPVEPSEPETGMSLAQLMGLSDRPGESAALPVWAVGPKPLPVDQLAAEATPLVDQAHPLTPLYDRFVLIDRLDRIAQHWKGGEPPAPDFSNPLLYEGPEGEHVRGYIEAGANAAKGEFAKPRQPEPYTFQELLDRAKEVLARYPDTFDGRIQAANDPQFQLFMYQARGQVIDILTSTKGAYETAHKAAQSLYEAGAGAKRAAGAARRAHVTAGVIKRTTPEIAGPRFETGLMRLHPEPGGGPPPAGSGGLGILRNPTQDDLNLIAQRDPAGEVAFIRDRVTGDKYYWPRSRLSLENARKLFERLGPNALDEHLSGGSGETPHGGAGSDQLIQSDAHYRRVELQTSPDIAGAGRLASPQPGDVSAEVLRQQIAADANGYSLGAAAAIGHLPADHVDETYAATADADASGPTPWDIARDIGRETQAKLDRGEPVDWIAANAQMYRLYWQGIKSAFGNFDRPFGAATAAELKAGRPQTSLPARILDELGTLGGVRGTGAPSAAAQLKRYDELQKQGKSPFGDAEMRDIAINLVLGFGGATTPKVPFREMPRVAEPGGFQTWHGSPHYWENLDPAAVGSGEGNAAFGYGANYSAEAKNVASSYRSGAAEPPLLGEGYLYRLNIKRPQGEFLDWDQPLSQMDPYVQERLKKLGYDETTKPAASPEVIKGLEDRVASLSAALQSSGSTTVAGLLQRAKFDLRVAQGHGALTGSQIYEDLSRSFGKRGDKAASEKLAELGIAGIRYLDRQSRGKTGPGATRNFVTFRAEDVQPLTVNGEPITEKVDLQPQRVQITPPVGFGTEPTQRRPAITAINLRALPPSEAAAVAESGAHLMQDASGQFIGAPRGFTDQKQIVAMRRDLDRAVQRGIEFSGWYKRGRAGAEEIVGPDPARHSMLGRVSALYSWRKGPEDQLGLTFQAMNQAMAGQPVTAGLAVQRAMAQAALASGDPSRIKLSLKSEPYAQALTPGMPQPSVGVNDAWMARLFGYGEKSQAAEGGASDQEHAFMDGETVLATARANKMRLGGRSDWTAPEIQEAAWVSTKGRADGERLYNSRGNINPKTGKHLLTLEQSISQATRLAARAIPDFFPKYTAFMTGERIPLAASGHIAGIETAPWDVKMRFSDTASWLNQNGRDQLMQDLGVFQRQGFQAVGVWHPHDGGPVEHNPVFTSRPMVGFTGSGAGKTLDNGSEALLNSIGYLRDYMYTQGAVPSHIQTADGPQFTYRIGMPRPPTTDEVAKLDALVGPKGLSVIDDGNSGLVLMPLDYGNPAVLRSALKNGLDEQIRAVIPDALKGERRGFQGTYPSMEAELAADNQGKGLATQRLFAELDKNPAILQRLDSAPSIRREAMAILERDRAIWEWEHGGRTVRAGDPRPDIERAMQILADDKPKPFTRLRKALEAGMPLPAVLIYGIFSAQGDGS